MAERRVSKCGADLLGGELRGDFEASRARGVLPVWADVPRAKESERGPEKFATRREFAIRAGMEVIDLLASATDGRKTM